MPAYPKYQNRKMEYNSPSGYVHIGKYIPPFEEVENGFGFKGVIVEDFDSGKLQCHICGEWFENMPTHLNLTHQVLSADYKRMFGLLQSTALKSKRLRVRQSEVMTGMRKKHKKHRMKFEKGNEWASNRKGTKRAVEGSNKYGVCDLQILQRVKELAKELNRTPTLLELRDRYGMGLVTIMAQRYGSYIQYCRDNGLEPGYSNFNPKYSKQYFIEKALSDEPSLKIYTLNERRAFYKFFKGGIAELKMMIEKYREMKRRIEQ